MMTPEQQEEWNAFHAEWTRAAGAGEGTRDLNAFLAAWRAKRTFMGNLADALVDAPEMNLGADQAPPPYRAAQPQPFRASRRDPYLPRERRQGTRLGRTILVASLVTGLVVALWFATHAARSSRGQSGVSVSVSR